MCWAWIFPHGRKKYLLFGGRDDKKEAYKLCVLHLGGSSARKHTLTISGHSCKLSFSSPVQSIRNASITSLTDSGQFLHVSDTTVSLMSTGDTFAALDEANFKMSLKIE